MFFKKSSVLTFIAVAFIFSSPVTPTHAENIFNFLKKKQAQQENADSESSSPVAKPVYNVPKEGSSTVAPLFIIPPKTQNYTPSYTYKGVPYTVQPVLKARTGMSLAELTALNKYNGRVRFEEERERINQRVTQLHWQHEQARLQRDKKRAQEAQQQEVRKMVYPKKEKKDTEPEKPRLLFFIPD